jgi:hypothetical protein
VRLESLRSRCPMTTVDPDTLQRDPEVLRDIGRRFGGYLALDAAVVRGGRISVGDPATLHPAPRDPDEARQRRQRVRRGGSGPRPKVLETQGIESESPVTQHGSASRGNRP